MGSESGYSPRRRGRRWSLGDNFSSLSSVERYDPAANAWVAVAPMASARCSVSMAVLDGKLFAVGGEKEEVDEDEDDDAGCFRLVERYDPALDAWEAVAPMGTARCFHGIAVLEVD